MKKDSGKVDIHGKEYLTVAYRVNQFRENHKLEYSIVTDIIEQTDHLVIMRASIMERDGFIIATGHAEEKRGSSQINRTSALENCETSAIGRALAAFGYAGTEFASADEVAQAISQQSQPEKKPRTKKTVDKKLVQELKDELLAYCLGNEEDAAEQLKSLTTFETDSGEKFMEWDKLDSYSEKWVKGALAKIHDLSKDPF